MARMRSADRIAQCPSSEAKRTTLTRGEYIRILTHFGNQHSRPEMAPGCGQAPTGTGRVECCGSGLAASEDVLLDDRVNAPITVNHLRDTEVNANRD